MNIAEFDALAAAKAADALRACCGSSRWVSAMVARRPFGSRESLVQAAEAIWRSLQEGDWQEAFRHHPRIGEREGAVAQSGRGPEWSSSEQAGVERADDDTRRMLAAANREYEHRFGYVYIVNAAGKHAEEMLALARGRLANSPELELHIAASEQLQITRNRLAKLLANPQDGGSAS